MAAATPWRSSTYQAIAPSFQRTAEFRHTRVAATGAEDKNKPKDSKPQLTASTSLPPGRMLARTTHCAAPQKQSIRSKWQSYSTRAPHIPLFGAGEAGKVVTALRTSHLAHGLSPLNALESVDTSTPMASLSPTATGAE
jgi:hypothetical protein